MAVVIVGAFFSRCSACNGNADPNESAHWHGGREGGWQPSSSLNQTNGCGAPFTARIDDAHRPIGGTR